MYTVRMCGNQVLFQRVSTSVPMTKRPFVHLHVEYLCEVYRWFFEFIMFPKVPTVYTSKSWIEC